MGGAPARTAGGGAAGRPPRLRIAEIVNAGVLLALPVVWTAPLLRASLLPFLGGETVSVLGGVATLWRADPALAALVAVLAVAAPLAKAVALALLLRGRLPARAAPWLSALGRLAMADMFLIAVYVVAAKGVGVGAVETAWGLYAFTAVVLAGLWAAWTAERALNGR